MLALALTLALHGTAAFSPERWVTGAFANDAEATNFSAHVGWSLAVPLAGHAIDGKRGALIAGSGWMAYSLVNEFALHGPEDARERRLNLISRLVPCAAVMLWEIFNERKSQ